jgi:V/A-type H+/Na+-transporting ATPase subunit A
VSIPLERQQEAFNLLRGLIDRDYPFTDKEEARAFFTKLTGLLKNLNYTARDAKEYEEYRHQIEELAHTLGRVAATEQAA